MPRLKITKIAITALGLIIAALPLALQAQTVRCVGKDGKKYFGQTLPPQCVGQAAEYLDKSGNVIRRTEATLTQEQRLAKEADEKKKAEAAAVAKDEARRNRALLETYSSEKDIDLARQRALKDNEAAVKEIEARVAKIGQRGKELQKEMEFYQGKNKPPAKLAADIKNNEIDLKSQTELLAAKKKEVDSINTKYDEDKKRLIALTKGQAEAAPTPAAAAKPAKK